MKKLLSILLSMVIILSVPMISYAGEQKVTTSVEYFDDGSYLVTEITQNDNLITRATSSKSGSKTARHYNSKDELEWVATLNATFTYTGSSATCTNATVSYKIYDDTWKCASAKASKSGRTAKGDFVFNKYILGINTKAIEKSITLSCSNTGTLS